MCSRKRSNKTTRQSTPSNRRFFVEDDNFILRELLNCGESDMCKDQIWMSVALMLNKKQKKNFSREDVRKRWTSALDQRMESYYGVQNLPSLTELGMRDEMSDYQKLSLYQKRFIQARAQVRARANTIILGKEVTENLDTSGLSVDHRGSVQETHALLDTFEQQNSSQIEPDSENDDAMQTTNRECDETPHPESRIRYKRSYIIDWSPKQLPKVFKSSTAGASSIDWPEYKLPGQLFTGYSFIILESKTDVFALGLSQMLEYFILLHGGNVIESRDELEEGDELVFIAGGRKKKHFPNIPDQIYSPDLVIWHVRENVPMSDETMMDHICENGPEKTTLESDSEPFCGALEDNEEMDSVEGNDDESSADPELMKESEPKSPMVSEPSFKKKEQNAVIYESTSKEENVVMSLVGQNIQQIQMPEEKKSIFEKFDAIVSATCSEGNGCRNAGVALAPNDVNYEDLLDLSDDCESLDSALEPVAHSTAGAASITQPAGRMVLDVEGKKNLKISLLFQYAESAKSVHDLGLKVADLYEQRTREKISRKPIRNLLSSLSGKPPKLKDPKRQKIIVKGLEEEFENLRVEFNLTEGMKTALKDLISSKKTKPETEQENVK